MKNEPLYYLEIMLEYSKRTIEYLDGITYEEFTENKEKQDSISHTLYRLSEASIQLDDNFKNECPEINWKDIHGLRVLLAHVYHNIDFSILYNIANEGIPELKTSLERVINDLRPL